MVPDERNWSQKSYHDFWGHFISWLGNYGTLRDTETIFDQQIVPVSPFFPVAFSTCNNQRVNSDEFTDHCPFHFC